MILRLCLPFILLCLSAWPSTAPASGLIAVQSINIKPYNEALKGFREACNCDAEQFIISEMEGTDIIKKIHEERPDVILAVGVDALGKVKNVKNIPVVYVMVLNPQSVLSSNENITGVSLYVAPEKQLSVLKNALPGLKSVGLLFDPLRSGDFVRKASLAASAAGIELTAKEVRNSKDVPAMLKELNGKINAFWMLPDITVITPETVEYLFLYTLENKIPVMTFSDKYLGMGALMSLDADAYDIGKQAWEITKNILSGTPVRELKETDARDALVTINQKIAGKLGITISRERLNKARVVNGK
ncbi:MAG: ABC transporter substrate-binding protein [Nitrospirae bacterium]|nr:ABC transporter substrate-binding protein [Nitrospirota bacterium]